MKIIIPIYESFESGDQEDFPEVTENELKKMVKELLNDSLPDTKDEADTA